MTLIDKVRRSTARVWAGAMSESKREHRGQGLILNLGGDDLYVLTCDHVIASVRPEDLYVEVPQPDLSSSSIVPAHYISQYSDPASDVAVLRINANLIDTNPQLFSIPDGLGFLDSERVIGVTYLQPDNFDARLAPSTSIRISGRRLPADDTARYEITAYRLADPTDARPGISGAPVIFGGGVIGLAESARDEGPRQQREVFLLPISAWVNSWPELNALVKSLPQNPNIAQYLTKLQQSLQEDNDLRSYIPLRLQVPNGKQITSEQEIQAWLSQDDEPLLVILGEYGSGKTTLLKSVALDLSNMALTDNDLAYLPIYAPLRDIGHLFVSGNPLRMIAEHYGIRDFDSYENTPIFMLDGFDELVNSEHRNAFIPFLRSLITQRRAKIAVTARTHFFRSEIDAFDELGQAARKGSGLDDVEVQAQSIRNAIRYLLEFNTSDIRAYLNLSFGAESGGYYNKLLRIYDLGDLAKRPILLRLIVRLLPDLDDTAAITESDIYEKTIDLWLRREAWRGIEARDVLSFMVELATSMFLSRKDQLNFRDLAVEVQRRFAAQILSKTDLEYFDSLIRTSSFLNRDAHGNFVFMHRSFMEYFFAQTLRDRITSDKLQVTQNDPDVSARSILGSPKKVGVSSGEVAQAGDSGTRAEAIYELSDGIIELLSSTLMSKAPSDPATAQINQYVEKRKRFREDERALWRAGEAIRSRKELSEADQWDARKAFDRVNMIGGQGRIYYTVEHYSFQLAVNSKRPDGAWTLFVNYYESWQHT